MTTPVRLSLVFGTCLLLGLLVACNKESGANPGAGAGAGAPGAAGGGGRTEMMMNLKNYQVSIAKKLDDVKARMSTAGAEVQKASAEKIAALENQKRELTNTIGGLPAVGWQDAAKEIKTALGELEKGVNELADKIK
jgi:hypothetical protein